LFTANGVQTSFLGPCPAIEDGINQCHAQGKLVFLSLGGATPYNQPPNRAVAEYFAEFLWGAFGPPSTSPPRSWAAVGSPRPFGNAAVDGFDFDIEHGPSTTYAFVINRLRQADLIGGNTFYISAAPQCIVPDASLGNVIVAAAFDFLFIQFYNTPYCSSRAGVNDIRQGTSQFTFATWVNWVRANSLNPLARIYIGLVSVK
jgi:chitinase